MPPRLELLMKRWSKFDLPVLPFLAPRLFQPWPRNLRRTHSATKAVQTKSDTPRYVGENHDNSPQHLVREKDELPELKSWTPQSVLETDPLQNPGARDSDGVFGKLEESTRDGMRPDGGNMAAAEVLGEDGTFWAKYEEIWGGRAKKPPPESPVATVRKAEAAEMAVVEPERPRGSSIELPSGSIRCGLRQQGKSRKPKLAAAEGARQSTLELVPKRRTLAEKIQKKRSNARRKERQALVAKWKKIEKAQTTWMGVRRKERRFRSQNEVRGMPKVPLKFIRLAPAGDFGHYSFSSSWNWRFAMLNTRYDPAMKGRVIRSKVFTYKNPRVSRTFSKALIENVSTTSMREAWMKLPSQRRRHIWPEIMLTALEDYPEDALNILEATFMEPYPPGYAIADSLDYITEHYLRNWEAYPLKYASFVLEAVRRFLTESPKDHLHISQRTIYRIMTLSDRNSSANYLKRFYGKLIEVDHPLHENTLIHFGTRFAKKGETYTACKVIQKLKDQGSDFSSPKMLSFFSNLLQWRHRSRRLPSKEGGSVIYLESDIFDFMLGSGATPNITTYNILLQNALEAGDHDTAWQLHDMMVETGLQPDAYTYSMLLNDAKLRMDPSAIRKVMDYVRQNGIRNSQIVTDVLHAILLLHQQERQTWDDSMGPKPQQQPAFDRLLQVYCDYFHLEPLARIIPNFLERYPNLRRAATADSTQPLEDPPAPTLVVMITGFLDYRQTSQPAKQFYDHFRELLLNNDPAVALLTQTTHIWNLVLKTYSMFPERLSDCPNVIGDMLSAPDRTPTTSQPPLTNDEGSGIDSQPALEIYNTPPHDSSPEAVSRDPLPELNDLPSNSSVLTPPKPDVYTWSILLKIFMDQSQPRAAEKVLTMMRKRGIEPNQVTWNKLAHGYARMQDANMVVDVVRRLEEAGLQADEFTMSALGRIRNRRALIEAMRRKEGEGKSVKVEASNKFLEELKGSLETGKGGWEKQIEDEDEDEDDDSVWSDEVEEKSVVVLEEKIE